MEILLIVSLALLLFMAVLAGLLYRQHRKVWREIRELEEEIHPLRKATRNKGRL